LGAKPSAIQKGTIREGAFRLRLGRMIELGVYTPNSWKQSRQTLYPLALCAWAASLQHSHMSSTKSLASSDSSNPIRINSLVFIYFTPLVFS